MFGDGESGPVGVLPGPGLWGTLPVGVVDGDWVGVGVGVGVGVVHVEGTVAQERPRDFA